MRRLTSARRRRRCGPAPSQPPPCVHPPVPARGLTSARRAVALQKKPKDDEAEEGGAAEPAAAAAADDDDDDDAALDFSKKKKKKPVRARPARPAPRRPPCVCCRGGAVQWEGQAPVQAHSCAHTRRADAPPCRVPPAEGAIGRGGGACARGRARRVQRLRRRRGPGIHEQKEEEAANACRKRPLLSASPLWSALSSRGPAPSRQRHSSPPPLSGGRRGWLWLARCSGQRAALRGSQRPCHAVPAQWRAEARA